MGAEVSDLKPCPVCADAAEFFYGARVRAECVGCGLQTRKFDSPQEAGAAWNRRDEVERLEDYLDALTERMLTAKRERHEARAEVQRLRSMIGAIYIALKPTDTEATTWPEEITRLRKERDQIIERCAEAAAFHFFRECGHKGGTGEDYAEWDATAAIRALKEDRE
jgi:hypothetical protein